MYEFEGVDYAKEPSAADKKAFDDLLSSKKIICCVCSHFAELLLLKLNPIMTSYTFSCFFFMVT